MIRIGVSGREAHRPSRRPPVGNGMRKGDDPGNNWCESDISIVEFHLGCCVIFYLADGRARGALMWNVRKLPNAARKQIAERVPRALPPNVPAKPNQTGGIHGH